MISKNLCVKCKGRFWCGKTCFVLEKFKNRKKVLKELKGKEFVGSSPPSVFVSWQNYPNITIAPLSPSIIMQDADLLDNPERWFGMQLEEIIAFRESLIQSRMKAKASEASNAPYKLQEVQEIAMSQQQLNLEIELEKTPKTEFSFFDTAAPLGPFGELQELKLQENPKIPRIIEKAYYDGDLKASNALEELYCKGVKVHELHKLLSAGILGAESKRKLVPTRWSITATDDIISKKLIEKAKDFQTIDSFELYNSSFLDNHFWILLLPKEWCFEQLEAWKPNTAWTKGMQETQIMQDFEFYKGRKNYASNVSGAYYSARLAVAEHLVKRRKQAGAIVFREIGSGYQVPIGVWEIRENVRKALQKKALIFSELNTALAFLNKKLSIPVKKFEKESKVLDFLKKQKLLNEFF